MDHIQCAVHGELGLGMHPVAIHRRGTLSTLSTPGTLISAAPAASTGSRGRRHPSTSGRCLGRAPGRTARMSTVMSICPLHQRNSRTSRALPTPSSTATPAAALDRAALAAVAHATTLRVRHSTVPPHRPEITTTRGHRQVNGTHRDLSRGSCPWQRCRWRPLTPPRPRPPVYQRNVDAAGPLGMMKASTSAERTSSGALATTPKTTLTRRRVTCC